MDPSRDKILGITVPVIIAEMELDLMVEGSMDFIHHARNVYDLVMEATLDCFAGEGFVLFQGHILEDIYYVGFIDGILRCQVFEKSFNGFKKHPTIKKGMLCRGTASIHEDNIINEIADNCRLHQKLVVNARIKVLQEETISRSLLVTGPLEHPIYHVGTLESQQKHKAVYGAEERSSYPDMNLDDPLAVISSGKHWWNIFDSEQAQDEETICMRIPHLTSDAGKDPA